MNWRGFLFSLYMSIWAVAFAEEKAEDVVLKGGDLRIKAMRQPPQGSALFAAFQGKIPCGDCNARKIALTLHRNATNRSATTFLLEIIEVGKGDDRLVCGGSWSEQVANDKKSSVIALTGNCPAEFQYFLGIQGDVLLLLDREKKVRVGNPQLNYTLSRYTGPWL